LFQLNSSFVLSIILSIAISLSGSIFFILLPSPHSIVLFLLFNLLNLVILLTFLGKKICFRIRLTINRIQLSALFSAISITLAILQTTNTIVEPLNAALYFIVFIFVLGLSLLSILEFKHNLSHIEYLALAYPISLGILAIFGTTALLLPVSMRGMVESIAIAILCILSLIWNIIRRKEDSVFREVTLNNNALLLFTTLILFVAIFVGLYPQISNLLGLDISSNFLQALSFTKDNLSNFANPSTVYPLFGIFQSSMFYIFMPALDTFQIVAISLNLFTILSFYAMASQYLNKYGEHVAAIATLIWSTFAGFGWLIFVSNVAKASTSPLLAIIGQADMLSYGDITWRRLFFYLAMEATFALAFAVLYLLKRKDLSKLKQLLLMAILIIPIPLMHPYATYLLLPLLLGLTIFCAKELRSQLNSAGYSLMISALASFPLNLILNVKGLNISFSLLTFSEYLILGSIIVIATSLSLPSTYLRVFGKNFLTICRRLLIPFLLLFIFASLILWLSGEISFNFIALNLFGYVPLYLFPIKIGLAGLLTILAIYFLLINPSYRLKDISAIIFSLLLIVAFSIFMEMLQMEYVSTFTFNPNSELSVIVQNNILNFRAERMFEIFKIPLAIIASISLVQLKVVASKCTKKNAKHIIISCMIPIMLFAGMASTLLGFSYYGTIPSTNQVSTSELSMLSNLQNNLYATGKATIISPQTPVSYMYFTGATTIVTESSAAWESKSPELPLFVTRYSQTTPTYIYLEKPNDYQELNKYAGNYLVHTTNITDTYLENSEVQIKEINNTSIPTSNSKTALIVPYDVQTSSITEPSHQLQEHQYTIVSLSFEQNSQSVDSYNELINYNNVQTSGPAYFNGVNNCLRIIDNQTSFNRLNVEFEYQPLNLTNNQVIVSELDYGFSSKKSWEIAQYNQSIGFKISPDGNDEVVLLTPKVLHPNTSYIVKCQYDGTTMNIYINNNIVATKSYKGGIFKSNTDIIIGAELYNNNPTAFAKMQLNYIKILNGIPEIRESIFYSYDLLSAMGLNYTTVVSSDKTIGKYQTIILPYDDLISQNALDFIEKSQGNISNVIILNTNGYGTLLDIFGNTTSTTFSASGILNSQNVEIQPSIEVTRINLNNNTKVEAQYVNNNFSSPLIMTVTEGKLRLIYFNIYPLLLQNQILNPTSTQALSEIVSNHIAFYNESEVTSWFTKPSLLFTNFQANGTISVSSTAMASIELPENQTVDLENYNCILINSTEITVQGGYGFYTALTASNPSIILQGNRTVSINVNGNATFLLRQPKISVNGEIQFQNFHMLHPPTIYTDGRTTTLTGKITLDIYASDKYSIVLPYEFDSPITVKYATPLMQFNETTSFLQLMLFVLLILLFVIPIALIRRRFFKPVTSKIIEGCDSFLPRSESG
jgi:hypothetical protein